MPGRVPVTNSALTSIALDTALERLETAEQAARSGSRDQLLMALHSAKGLCGQLGEDLLAGRLHLIEDAVLDPAGVVSAVVAGQIGEVHKVLSLQVSEAGIPRTVSAEALLARVERDLTQTARRRGVDAFCHVEADSLDIPGRTAGLLLDLLGHLTRNAIVHGGRDGQVHVRLSLTGDSDRLHLVVSDGGGRTAAPSQSVDRDSGRGLGLAAVRARLADVGGRCDVAFSDDGATVTICLPLRW